MKAHQISVRFKPEVEKALQYWKKTTGIPLNSIVEQGTVLKIKELEKIYDRTHKEINPVTDP